MLGISAIQYSNFPNAPIDSIRAGNNIEIFNNSDSIKSDTLNNVIKLGGTKDPVILMNAPDPEITVRGKKYNAQIVVDTKNNILYKYDDSGNVKKAYKVSTGRENSPTGEGVYSVGWVEQYPYETAPQETLRSQVPLLFGEEAVVLYKVDEKTGAKKPTGIMIHGCYKDSDVGGNWSGGCVRMYNHDIHEIAYDARRQKGAFIKVK